MMYIHGAASSILWLRVATISHLVEIRDEFENPRGAEFQVWDSVELTEVLDYVGKYRDKQGRRIQ